MLNLQQIICVEPNVGTFFEHARRQPKHDYFVYDKLKMQLAKYVGFSAENPDLCNMEAYDVCIGHLVDVLDI